MLIGGQDATAEGWKRSLRTPITTERQSPTIYFRGGENPVKDWRFS
jgi:hypothetical protein